jgi:hypothetical protein
MVEIFFKSQGWIPQGQIAQIQSFTWQQFIPRCRFSSKSEAVSQKRHGRKFLRWRSSVQHIQMSQNQSFIWQKFIPQWRPGDNVIPRLFSKSDLA